jgi:lipid A disaccharide synthetase
MEGSRRERMGMGLEMTGIAGKKMRKKGLTLGEMWTGMGVIGLMSWSGRRARRILRLVERRVVIVGGARIRVAMVIGTRNDGDVFLSLSGV